MTWMISSEPCSGLNGVLCWQLGSPRSFICWHGPDEQRLLSLEFKVAKLCLSEENNQKSTLKIKVHPFCRWIPNETRPFFVFVKANAFSHGGHWSSRHGWSQWKKEMQSETWKLAFGISGEFKVILFFLLGSSWLFLNSFSTGKTHTTLHNWPWCLNLNFTDSWRARWGNLLRGYAQIYGVSSFGRSGSNCHQAVDGFFLKFRIERLAVFFFGWFYMGVSENSGTPKSSILIGFSIMNHPFWGTPIFGNIHFSQKRWVLSLLTCRWWSRVDCLCRWFWVTSRHLLNSLSSGAGCKTVRMVNR